MIKSAYHTNQTKKMKTEKQNKKIDKQLSPEMVIKIREIPIRPKR